MNAGSNQNLKAQAPVSIFKRPLSADWKQFAATVAKTVGHGAIGNWEDAASEAVDAMAALGLETKPEELIYLLIKRSLISAMLALLAESVEANVTDEKIDVIKSIGESKIFEANLEVGMDFFENPSRTEFVKESALLIQSWLQRSGVPDQAARNAASRLPIYFTHALNSEWRKNRKSYQPILEHFSSPFLKAGEAEWAWAEYLALLKRRVSEPIFDEPFGLQQIYVPLNAYYVDDKNCRDMGVDLNVKPIRQRRVVVSLEQEVLEWLTQDSADDVVRVISGGPGSGKSSFSKIFAAQLYDRCYVRPLFIPLHLIDPAKDLVEEVGRFVRDEGVLTFNPLNSDSADRDLLIIFDGLDELASQGKAAAETARAFVREVDRVAHRINLVRLRFKVLISGREVVVQENESEFRRPRQILNVLPYYSGELNQEKSPQNDPWNEYVDSSGVLQIDLRHEWWKKYGSLTGKSYESLPEPLKRKDLEEVTSQPLLNYLIALSYTRDKIDFTKNLNLNSVYADLVAAVHERGYERHRSYGPIRHMNVQDFVRVLEEIGLAAWHGDGRSTTVREIEEHCKKSGLSALLTLFREGAQLGVTKLLAAFFFRQHGQRSTGDPTFVFTHKSFGEYLAARRIVRAVERVCRELESRAKDLDAGWDEKDALKHWVEICGPSEVSSYLHSFLLNEISLKGEESVASWQNHLCKLFTHVVRNGLPMESVQVSPFKEMLFQARNAEEALLAALNACSRRTGNVADLNIQDPTAFGAWFKRIQGQRTSPESALAARCLSYLGFKGFSFDVGDFYGADFSFSNLSGIAAHYTCFVAANFRGAVLDDATMSSANLEHANFRESSAVKASFDDACLKGADFEGANLKGARFSSHIDVNLSVEQVDMIRVIDFRHNVESKD